MGNWNISIRGIGPHHNGKPFDAEQLAAELVDKLKAAGHNVVSAEVTFGGVEVLEDGLYGGAAKQARSLLSVVGVLLALLLPGLAFAADAAPTPLQSFFGQLSGPLLDLLLTAAIAGIGMLTAFLRAKSQESKAAGVSLLLTEAARTATLEIDRSLKPQLQAALADGVLTDTEKAQLKAAALDLLKTKLPAAALASAKGVFGDFLDTFLAGKVEQAVVEKNHLAARSVRAPVPPTP